MLTLRPDKGSAASPLDDPCLLAGKQDVARPDHQHMADSGVATPVNVPAGAIYTAADVHFLESTIAHHAQAGARASG